MKIRIGTMLGILCLTSNLLSAQTLCSVEKIIRNAEQLEILFKPDRLFRVVKFGSGGRLDFSLENGVLIKTDATKFLILPIEKPSIIFMHARNELTCILRVEERDGMDGLYVEEIYNAEGKPPRLSNEFLLAN